MLLHTCMLSLMLLFCLALQAQNRAKEMLQQAQEKLVEARENNQPQEVAQSLFELGRIHRLRFQDYPRAQKYFLQSIEAFEALSDSVMLGESWRNLGSVYNNMGDLSASREAVKTAIRILQKTDDIRYLNWSYNTLGIVYKNIGDYAQALDFYQQYLSYSITHGSQRDVGFAYNNIGTCYDEMENFDSARLYYRKALEIFKELKDADGEAAALLNLGRIANKKGEFDTALESYFQALEINEQEGDRYSMMVDFKNIGWSYRNKKEYQTARIYYEKSARLAKQLKARKVEEGSLREISDLYLQEKKYSLALETVQKALGAALGRSLPDDPLQNPPLEEINADHEIIPTFEQKGRILLLRYTEQSRTMTDLMAAWENYRLCIALIDKLRKEMDAKGSKLQLAANNLAVYENAIQTAQLMFEQTHDSLYLEEAFLIAEKNKAILLYERFLEHQTRMGTGQDRIANVDYRLKKSSEALSEIRDLVLQEQDQCLIEYFIGTKKAFVFVLTKDQLGMRELADRSVLDSLVKAFRHSISSTWETEILCARRSGTPDSLCQNLDSLKLLNQNHFIRYGQQLYQILISPLRASGFHDSSELIIIPDAFLSLLPFAALLTAQPAASDQFRSHPYFFKSHILSFAPSATLLASLNANERQQENEINLLAMAPFTYDNSRYRKLPYSKQEVENLHKKWGGEMLLGEDANLLAFQKYAPKSGVLHLSSHAIGDNKNNILAGIAFSDQDLWLDDIYPLQLQANMVLLSACETATGPLAEGEGILSLSHAFFHAGSQSVLASLWKVQDQATAELIAGFYENLARGLSKQSALQQAQLTYITNHDHRLAHPYFWAGWIPSGNMNALEMTEAPLDMRYVWMGLLMVLLGIGAFLYRRKF